MTEIREEIIDATTEAGLMAVLVKQPSTGGPFPTVVVFQDAPGIRESIHEFCRRFAAEGYRVVVPDLFHREGRLLGWESHEATPEIRARIRDLLNSLTDDGVLNDLDDALAAVGVEPSERLGAIGFCIGARKVIKALTERADQFAVGAGWHPSRLVDETENSPHLSAGKIVQPLYLGIGTDDQVQSIEMQKAFFDAVADLPNVEVAIYEGADHGFTWPTHPNYHEGAATGSWRKTTEMFAQALG